MAEEEYYSEEDNNLMIIAVNIRSNHYVFTPCKRWRVMLQRVFRCHHRFVLHLNKSHTSAAEAARNDVWVGEEHHGGALPHFNSSDRIVFVLSTIQKKKDHRNQPTRKSINQTQHSYSTN